MWAGYSREVLLLRPPSVIRGLQSWTIQLGEGSEKAPSSAEGAGYGWGVSILLHVASHLVHWTRLSHRMATVFQTVRREAAWPLEIWPEVPCSHHHDLLVKVSHKPRADVRDGETDPTS